jgi:hypothetical protein
VNTRGLSIVILGSVVMVSAGCQTPPPPPRASIPPVGTYTHDGQPVIKPLPEQGYQDAFLPAGFDDGPLLTQPVPEQAAFVQAYRQVGGPRVALFVNRTTDGQPIVNESQNPPIDRIDYDAVENVLTDWLAAGGKVVMVSPKLTESQARDLTQAGKQNVLQALSRESGIDVLVHVQAKLTRHYGNQTGVRLLAESVNTQGGESLARAFIDMPPVMDKPIINERTRFLARKLMADMTGTWQNMPAPAPTTSTPAPAPAPAPAVPERSRTLPQPERSNWPEPVSPQREPAPAAPPPPAPESPAPAPLSPPTTLPR